MNKEPQRESPVLGLLGSIDKALLSLEADIADLEDAMKLCLAQEQTGQPENECSVEHGNECDLTSSLEKHLEEIRRADKRILNLRGRCLL